MTIPEIDAERHSNKLLAIWSTDYAEQTGQGLVTRRAVEKTLPRFWRVRQYVFPPSGRPMAILIWVLCVLRLWRDAILKRFGTLYLVCSRSTPGFLRDLPALLTTHLGVRVVVHVHGSDIVSLLSSRQVSPLARWAYHKSELVVPSSHLVPQLADLGCGALHVCENFIVASERANKSISIEAKEFILLWNSNIMASKGVFDVMAAVRRMRAEGMDLRLLVIGSVLGDEEMPAAAAEVALADYVRDDTATYLGRVSSEEAAALVDIADAVALPSRYASELQPLSVIQAMVVSKAIVASDTPALRATLEDYPAEIVPVHSVDAIIAAVRRLIVAKKEDPGDFRGHYAASSAAARARFDPHRFDRTLAEILVGQNGR